MKPLKASEIFGVWATLLLPIEQEPQERIDFARLGEELDAIVDAKVHGVYSNGTAGEFYAQSEEEFDRVSELMAQKCEPAGLPFQIGVSHTSAQTSAHRLCRAKALRPAAFQIILPDWFPLNDAEMFTFWEKMVELAEPVGLILYNPPHAKRVLDGASLGNLAQRLPGIIGAKVGNVDESWFAQLGDVRSRLSIFTPGHMLARHLPMGSAGSYSNVACLNPAGARRWYEQMKTDPAGAMAFQERLSAFFAAEITPFITRDRYANAAADKLLATAGGWADVGTKLRWPYASIPAAEARRVGALARRALPELFA